MTTRQDAMDRAGETGEVVFGREGKCSDERPCLPCYLDQGRCQAAPVAVATSDAERTAYPALPSYDVIARTYFGDGVDLKMGFSAEAMRAYVDADRKERQLAACNFCLAEAAKARAALPIDFKQATDQGGLADALHPA